MGLRPEVRLDHPAAVTADRTEELRTSWPRVAVTAAITGLMLAGLDAWAATPAAATSPSPAIYAQPYSRPVYLGPRSLPASRPQPSGDRYRLRQIRIAREGEAVVFSLTITRPSAHPGLSTFPAGPIAFRPVLQLVKNPALAPTSASDPCNLNCTFNLGQDRSGWVFDEYSNGRLVTVAGPATVTVHGSLVSVSVDIATLAPDARRVMEDPTTDVQAGFVTQAGDGSSERYVSNPYALGSLTGLGAGRQVYGPWQGRVLGAHGLSSTPCSGSDMPLWFTYDPAAHLENIQFSRPVDPGITVEGGGSESAGALANFITVVVRTAGSRNGSTRVSSIATETNNQPLVPLTIVPQHAYVAGSSITVSLADASGNAMIPPGGFLTAAVSLPLVSGTCIYHFPLVPIALFTIPTPPVPSTVSSSVLLGGSPGFGIGAALFGVLALIGVLISRFQARSIADDGDYRPEGPSDPGG
ncbi:MAG: hypothetical protein ACYCV7_10875 [Acidimicrobiales bacterium]